MRRRLRSGKQKYIFIDIHIYLCFITDREMDCVCVCRGVNAVRSRCVCVRDGVFLSHVGGVFFSLLALQLRLFSSDRASHPGSS